MMPYVCSGTIVQVRKGPMGRVVDTDRKNKTAVVYTGKASIVTRIENLEVISYKEVH